MEELQAQCSMLRMGRAQRVVRRARCSSPMPREPREQAPGTVDEVQVQCPMLRAGRARAQTAEAVEQGGAVGSRY